MIEFGKTLREAREAKGYSVSQLAELTHILPQIVENLEHEDFSKIVAPIYGRGFVKLYCEAVDIDPKPLVAEFMEIFNGNRPPVIRMREIESNPEVKGPAEEQKVPVPEPPTFESEVRDDLPAAVTEPSPERPLPSEPFKPEPGDLPFPEEPMPPKRDYRLPSYALPEVPRRFWRFGILGIAAIGIVLLIIFSCRALYRVTMGVEGGQEETAVSTEQHEGAPIEQKMPRTNVKTPPPLYID